MKVGDCVYVSEWWCDDFDPGPGPHIVAVTAVDATHVGVRSSQVRHRERQTFYHQEIVFSQASARLCRSAVVGHCFVLRMLEFRAQSVAETDEADVYLCQLAYNQTTHQYRPLKLLHWTQPPLVPLSGPRALRRAHLAASDDFSVNGVPVVFVSDAMVGRHVLSVNGFVLVANPPRVTHKRKAALLATSLIAGGDDSLESELDSPCGGEQAYSMPALASHARKRLRLCASPTSELDNSDVDLHDSGTSPHRVDRVVSAGVRAARGGGSGASLFQVARKGALRRCSRAAAPSYLSPNRLAYKDGGDPTDRNDDMCRICGDTGLLLCCDACPATYHQACLGPAHRPAPDERDDEKWFCPECAAGQGRSRGRQTLRGQLQTATPQRGANASSSSSSSSRSGSDIDSSSQSDSDADNSADAHDGAADPGAESEFIYDDETQEERRARQEGHTDAYFSMRRPGAGKSKTSSKTLAKLDISKMDRADIAAEIKAATASHPVQLAALFSRLQAKFARWKVFFRAGFNVLCHGFGSKQNLLLDFAKSQCAAVARPHLVINGFFPSLQIKHALDLLTHEHLGHSGTFRSVGDQAEFIVQTISDKSHADVVLIVHNIDGPMLRTPGAQTALATLASHAKIHVVASVDHVNASLLWDYRQLAQMNWIWQDCTTFAAYDTETAFLTGVMGDDAAVSVQSVLKVMENLSPNAHKSFYILAAVQWQVQSDRDSPRDFSGISFLSYLNLCVSNFAASSDNQLRNFLTEFSDHKLLKAQNVRPCDAGHWCVKNFTAVVQVDGVEHLTVNMPTDLLRVVLDSIAERWPAEVANIAVDDLAA